MGGLQIAAPKGHRTHPMSDKARGGIFNVLGDIEGFSVLDAFAGSGAVGLEALSRGAKAVTAVEQDRQAHEVVVANARALGVGRAFRAVHASVAGWLSTSANDLFDLIVADPPYDRLQETTIVQLPSRLKDHGLFVLSWPTHQDKPRIDGVSLLRTLVYGDATIYIFRRNQNI